MPKLVTVVRFRSGYEVASVPADADQTRAEVAANWRELLHDSKTLVFAFDGDSTSYAFYTDAVEFVRIEEVSE